MLEEPKTMVRRLGIASAVGLALALCSPFAGATVVERVVAVVGERAILPSDLKTRAAPFLLQVAQTAPEGAQRNAAISQVYRAILDKIVDEELEERAATQAKVAITAR